MTIKKTKHLVENCLGGLLNNLNAISKYIRSIQARNDGVRDSGELLRPGKNMTLLKCLNQILKLIQVLLAWLTTTTNLHDEAKHLVAEFIRKLAAVAKSEQRGGAENNNDDDDDEATRTSCDEFYAYNYLARLKDVVVDVNTAELLVHVLDELSSKVVARNNRLRPYEAKCKMALVNVCAHFVLNSDFNARANSSVANGKQAANQSVSNLLSLLIKNDEDPLKRVEDLLAQISNDDFLGMITCLDSKAH